MSSSADNNKKDTSKSGGDEKKVTVGELHRTAEVGNLKDGN